MTNEEVKIVNAGKKVGKTPQQVAVDIAKYRNSQNKVQQPASSQYSFGEAFGDIKEGLAGAASSVLSAGKDIVNTATDQRQSIHQRIVSVGSDAFKGVSRFIGNVYGTGAKLALPQSAENKIDETFGNAVNAVANTDIAKNIYREYQSLPFEKRLAVDNSLGYLEGIASLMSAGQGKNVGAYVVNTLKKADPTVNNSVQAIANVAKSANINGRKDIAENIMQRVARIDPTKEIEFDRLTGKKVGQFLVERGEYNSPEKLIKNLYEESARSYKQVDDEFEKIYGTFRPPVFEDMVPEMLAREKRVSATGAPSKDLEKVTAYAQKWENGDGLTMKEINDIKRIYERTVKLGYAKEKNVDMTERATNMDTALRKWQLDQAKTQGFENLDEINKNTQATRFLADQLWRKEMKMSANNALGLTEAVLLSGGSINSISMALTRRFIGNKTVQAKIAELLGGKSEYTKVTPNIREAVPVSRRIEAGAIRLGGPTSPQTTKVSPSQLQQEVSPLPTVMQGMDKTSTTLSTRGRQTVSSPNNTTRPLSVAKQELENIKQQIDFAEAALSEFPHSSAKELMRFYKKGDKSLSEVNYQALGTGRKSKDLDSMVTELGFKDMDEAQTAIDNYITARDNIAADKRYYQQLRKEVRSGEDVASYDTPAYTAETLSDADIASITKRLTRERGALGAPSDEWLLAQAKRELSKTPNDAKLKRFIADKELMAEARKYKTVEEFVKAQGTPVYRGTVGKNLEDTSNGLKILPDATFTTTAKQTAKGYAGDAGTVHELIISPDAKFFETSPQEIAQWLKKKERELFPLVQEQQMFADAKKGAVQLDEITKKNINVSQQAKEEYGKWLKTNGYDGYSMKRENGIEYAVINKDKIKTRSQLIDIWNKAQNINSRQ